MVFTGSEAVTWRCIWGVRVEELVMLRQEAGAQKLNSLEIDHWKSQVHPGFLFEKNESKLNT